MRDEGKSREAGKLRYFFEQCLMLFAAVEPFDAHEVLHEKQS